MAEIAIIHQGGKIRRGSNEAICSPKASSRKRKDERVKRQGYARNDAQTTYYLANT